jgi:hypothetical protein
MRLEEEILINQFAQGVYSDETLLTRFSQLDEAGQSRQFMELSFLIWQILIWQMKTIEADAAQALLDSSLGSTYVPGMKVTKLMVRISSLDVSGKDPVKEYTFLLYLYKVAYQRLFAGEKSNPASWLYQDLSKPETVQSILDTHQSLVDRLYANTSFHTEFAALAKHWHQCVIPEPASDPEVTPVRQENFSFMSYKEIIDYPLDEFIGKRPSGIGLLCNALANALIIQFKVTDKQARRLIQDVVAKHWQVDDRMGLS